MSSPTLSFASLSKYASALATDLEYMVRDDGGTFYTATVDMMSAAARAYMNTELTQMQTTITQIGQQLTLNQFKWIPSVGTTSLSQITSMTVVTASGLLQAISAVGTKYVPWTTAPSGGFNALDISINSNGSLLVKGSNSTSYNYPTTSQVVTPDTSSGRIGITSLGYDSASTSVAATDSAGNVHSIPLSTPAKGQVSITNVAMESDGTLSLTDSEGNQYTIPKLVYGGLDELPRGGHTFQIGDRRIYAYGVDNVYGSSFDIAFPAAYTEIPVVYVVATQEYNTEAAILANVLAGSVTASGFKVSVVTVTVGSTAAAYSTSANGCFLWVLSIGTQ